MKKHKLQKLLTGLVAGFFIANVFAVEPQIKEEALVIPKPNESM